MTARRFNLPFWATAAAMGAGSIAILGFAAAWIFASAPAAATAETATIAPSKATALVRVRSGATSDQNRAVGEEAKLINAALPFQSGPIAAARPFQMSGDQIDRNRALLCLTQAIYYEAGLEPLGGRRAVAQVVLNRLRHSAFPKSICGVVYQGARSGVCQFTFVCDGALYRAPELGAWREARAVAETALAGYVERSVGEATHYHADYVAPRWAPLLAKVRQIGVHIFYRWPGAWGQPQAFFGHYIGEPADPASLRPARIVLAENSTMNTVVETGSPVRRAPNDVGGLLDTSKGWTLNIPDPRDTNSTSSRVLAAQKATVRVTGAVIVSATPTVLAVR